MGMKICAAALAALVAIPGGAMAQPVDLAGSAHVTERLVVARVGDRLRKACPTASVRWVRVWREVESLKSWARERGHSKETVDAFLSDRSQKDRIYALADSYLEKAGYTGSSESACTVARGEVAQGTPVGALLRVR